MRDISSYSSPLRLAALLTAAAAAGRGVVAQTPSSVVQTTYGPVQGSVIETVTVYGSIPFASPPINNLRFRAPTAPEPWTTTKNVTLEPPSCPQMKLDADIYIGSEDCLYLSVYVPEGASPSSPLPVLFWIFGGAYVLGDESEFGWYDGKNLAAKRNVIVVSANYRVGPFGFTALPALAAEDPDSSTGNAALQDQRFALQWVQANIGAFGGNKSTVTIFGESAGGFSICYHMASPASAGLFASAIMESGSCDTPQFFQTLETAQNLSLAYACGLGCNAANFSTPAEQLACLRNLSTADMLTQASDWLDPNWPYDGSTEEEGEGRKGDKPSQGRYPTFASRPRGQLLDYFNKTVGMPREVSPSALPPLSPIFPWGPAIDGRPTGLVDVPLKLIQQGKFNRVPWIMGTNHDEGSIFVPLLPFIVHNSSFPPSSIHDIQGFIQKMLDMYNSTLVTQLSNEAINFYNISNYPDNNFGHLGSDMLTHYFFTCGTRRTARAAAAYTDVFTYQFTYKLTWIEYLLVGVYHSSELSFVWDNQWPPILHDFTGNDQNISDAFTGYWSNMAYTGNPNKGPASDPSKIRIDWPRYDPIADVNLQMEWPLGLTAGLLDSNCDLWDSIFAQTTGLGWWTPTQ